jgi:hypothetical protein
VPGRRSGPPLCPLLIERVLLDQSAMACRSRPRIDVFPCLLARPYG